MCRLLPEHGADMNKPSQEYEGAIQAASRQGQIEIVHLLSENGADFNICDGKYGSRLEAADREGHSKTAELLMEWAGNTFAHSSNLYEMLLICWK